MTHYRPVLVILLAGLFSESAAAADITLSQRLTGPVIALRGQWYITAPVDFRLPPGADIISSRWFYQLTTAAPAGFQAQLCHGNDCILLNAGRGTTRWFNHTTTRNSFYLRFRIESGAVIPPALRVISAGVQITYRQSSVRNAGKKTPCSRVQGEGVTCARRY